MEERVPVIPEGTIFSVDSNARRKQRWCIGAFIAFNGIEETYKAALYNGKTPTDYPAVLKIVPHGNEPPPADFQFYFDNADPKDRWIKAKKFKNVSLPVLLGVGDAEFKGMDYQFIIMKWYEKDVWSLFMENGRKLNEHTVYKVGLRLLSTIHYIHNQGWIHNDIRGSNIMVDASEKHIYLVNYHSASRYTNDKQVNFNRAHNVAVEYMSRDAHKGVSTMRGDIESLFYNLVQWLGVRLPWEKNLGNVTLVKQQKISAFANVEQFLRECFERREVPDPIRKCMNFIAIMNPQSKSEYCNLKMVLRYGLSKLCHVPEGNLSFPLDDVSDDETAEGSSDVKQHRLRRGEKSKLGASVDQLAKIISKNCKGEDEVNLQGEVVSGSLIHAIYQITRMRKSQVQQDKLANAWEKDIEGLRSKTKRLWSLKAQRRATSNTALAQEHEEQSQGWHAPAAVSNNGLNHNNPSCSFSRVGTMNRNSTPLPEVSPSIEPNILTPNVHQILQDTRSACSSRSNPVQSSLFRSSSSGYSSRCSSRAGFHSEDLPLFRTPDSFLEKEPCQSSKGVAVESTEETGSTGESVDSDQWLKAYQRLNTWLGIKELVLKALAPIPLEPSKTTEQLETVQFLSDEFRSGEPRALYRQLMNVLATLPPDSVDSRKLLQIQQRWRDQLHWLEGRGRELGEASLARLRDALQGATNNLDKLLDQNPEEQLLCKLLVFAEQLDGQKTLLANARIMIEKVCQTFSDPVFNTKIRAELQFVNGLYDDLQRRVGVKKNEMERSLKEEHEFDDSCKKIIVWLAKELDMSEKLIVSADPEKLRKQLEQYQHVMAKEDAVTELLRKGRDYLSRPQNRKTATQQSLLEPIKSQWERLRKSSLNIYNRLKICTEHHKNYCQAQKLLEPWLSEIEHKLGGLHPTTLDEVEEALTELSSLRTEMSEKLDEFERCTNLGETFVNACDEDKDVVKDELIAVKDRWKKMNNDVRERAQFLKDIADRFDVFNKCLANLERRVGEMKSRDALRAETEDLKPLGRIQKLREEAGLLQGSPVKDVRQLADELASKVGGHGINTSRLSSEVDRVVADIESFLHKAYEKLFASIENDIKPTIIAQEQDIKPKVCPSMNNQLSNEIVDLVSDGEGEADNAIEEKPKLLPMLSEEPIDLTNDNEADFAAT